MIKSDFWFGRRVLVTGHTGFKGSWLSLWLQQLGANICGCSLPPESNSCIFSLLSESKYFSSQISNHFCDIRDLSSLNDCIQYFQPEFVFHLAAQPLVRSSYEDPLQTWSTNLIGTLNLLECLKSIQHDCSVVIVTTDKVYHNSEWVHGYREDDPLGGVDPYSASKAATEIAVKSWRQSFVGSLPHQTSFLKIATARAGNVIGGGDWAKDRVVPDSIRSLSSGIPIYIRNSLATRPWQHVLEPLSGYLLLAQSLMLKSQPPCEAFNFGPPLQSNRTVADLVNTITKFWPGEWVDQSSTNSPHEASLLHLQIDKAYHQLGWRSRWNFLSTVEKTVQWYKLVLEGKSAYESCKNDLISYESSLIQ